MSANNKRSRKAKLVPRCATSDMELIMAEMEENHNMGENMVTNAGSEVIIKSEPESSNEGDTPKLSIEVEIEPYEDEDWHIPVKEESSEPTYSENTLPVSEAKEIKSEYDSDPEMQSILEEEAEFNKIASDPKNIAIMEKLLHDTNNLNATSTAFKTLQVEIEESSKGLDVENRINVSFIKKLTTEPYEDMLKKIADNGDKCLYKCSLCNLNWLSHEGFNKHISERHSNKAVWKIETKTNSSNKFIINLVKAPVLISNRCPNCNELFSEEAFLKRHLDETFKKCLKCMKLFHGCKQLHLHMPHCGIDSGHCTCDVFTGNPDERKGKNCICGRSGKFKKCIVCQASFMDDRKLLEHQNEYHVVSTKFEMNVSLKKCTACNMTYVGKKDLHDCYVKHKRVKCAMCKKKFQTQLLLDVHVKAMARPGIKCKVCNMPYYLECEKYNHVCVTRRAQSLLYRCDICKRTFEDHEDVQRHVQLEHLIHFSSVPKFVSLSNINEKKKKIKNIHKKRNIMVTFPDPVQPKRCTKINSVAQQQNVHTNPLDILEDEDVIMVDYSEVKTENLDPDENSAKNLVEVAPAIVEDKQNEGHESDLIKVFQATSTYSRFKIDNQLSTLVEIQKIDAPSTDTGEYFVEVIKEQNECIDIESDDERLVMDVPESATQKDEAPANTWTSCDKIKSESDIKTEFEVDLTESNSLSALLHGSPKTKEKKSNTNRNKPKMLRCSNCGFKSNRKLYKNHVNKCCKQHTVIPKTRDYKKPAFLNGFRSIHTCLLCRKDFTSLTLYYSHFIQHGYNARQCPYCMKVLEGESFMTHCFKHIKSNFYRFIAIDQKNKNETIRTIKCRQCKEDTLETDYLTHFENHYLKYEPEGELMVREKEADVKPKLGEVPVHLFREVIRTLTEVQMYERRPTMKQCVICFKKSDRNSEMKRHLIEHLLMDAKRATLTDGYLICQICSKVYQSTNQLKCHMREHAMLSVYECQICNKTFSDSSNFAKHKKVHDLKCLKCILCLKKFSSERMYAQHLELHKTLKSTQCPICKKFFHFESAFKKHYKMMHTKPSFKCQYCMARHPSLKTLWDHLWEVHKVRKVKADCKECGASFRKLQALRLHIMNTHSYLGVERIKKMKKMKDSVTSANDNSSAVSSTSIINID